MQQIAERLKNVRPLAKKWSVWHAPFCIILHITRMGDTDILTTAIHPSLHYYTVLVRRRSSPLIQFKNSLIDDRITFQNTMPAVSIYAGL